MQGALLALALAGCTTEAAQMVSRAAEPPPMRWDHRPEAAEWTANTLLAVAQEDAVLADRVPTDIDSWCPAYSEAPLPQRRAFWAGLISAVGKYESSHNPVAVGGGGKYFGIMQISPRSARNYGCTATSGSALKDGTANLDCAVEMMAYHVERDGMAVGNGTRGIGRDWMPFRKSDARAEMRDWISQQIYCQKS